MSDNETDYFFNCEKNLNEMLSENLIIGNSNATFNEN